MIPGQVRAIHRRPLNVGIRVRVGERTDLRVGWLWGSLVTAALGYDVSVTVVIPADAIHLEFGCSDWESDDEMVGLAGLFWSSRCRGNQLYRLSAGR